MHALATLAFFFLLFEIVQIVVLERYIGIRSIRGELDPREMPFPAWAGVLWLVLTKVYLLWTIVLLFEPPLRLAATLILAATGLGLILRRLGGMPWALVVFTFETAVRFGMLLAIVRWWLGG